MAPIVLVAVDFEEASRRAIEAARAIATPLGAELCLVHVYRLPVYTYPGFEPQSLPALSLDISRAAQGALDELAVSLSITRYVLREGDPSTEILAAAREVGAVMIAMGTHGRRGLARALLGSTAEKVVRSADVPVLTVRSAEASPDGAASGPKPRPPSEASPDGAASGPKPRPPAGA